MLEQVRALEADDAGVVRAKAPPQPPRLLVIDYDHLHCMIICRTATKAGFAPVGAGSYEEAAKLAQETAFDCITLDLPLGGTPASRCCATSGCPAARRRSSSSAAAMT